MHHDAPAFKVLLNACDPHHQVYTNRYALATRYIQLYTVLMCDIQSIMSRSLPFALNRTVINHHAMVFLACMPFNTHVNPSSDLKEDHRASSIGRCGSSLPMYCMLFASKQTEAVHCPSYAQDPSSSRCLFCRAFFILPPAPLVPGPDPSPTCCWQRVANRNEFKK